MTSHTAGGQGDHHETPTHPNRRDTSHAHRERLRSGLVELESECRRSGGGDHDLVDVHDLVHVDGGGQAGAPAQACDAQAAGRSPRDRDYDDDAYHGGAAASAAGDDHDAHEPAAAAAHDDNAHDTTPASADHHPAHDDHDAFRKRLHSAGRRRRC
jgi:hypothetical protein